MRLAVADTIRITVAGAINDVADVRLAVASTVGNTVCVAVNDVSDTKIALASLNTNEDAIKEESDVSTEENAPITVPDAVSEDELVSVTVAGVTPVAEAVNVVLLDKPAVAATTLTVLGVANNVDAEVNVAVA